MAVNWKLVAFLLDRSVSNMKFYSSAASPTPFDSKVVPSISMIKYLERINFYSKCSPPCFIYALIYIDRILLNNPHFELSPKNIHRIVLAAIILAIKYIDDLYLDNYTYSKIGGVSLDEFNSLESNILELLNYDLYVDSNSYFDYENKLNLQYLEIEEDSLKVQYNEEKCIKAVESTDTIITLGSP